MLTISWRVMPPASLFCTNQPCKRFSERFLRSSRRSKGILKARPGNQSTLDTICTSLPSSSVKLVPA
eukprot:11723422-Prorocentrum_lima.AAC.1